MDQSIEKNSGISIIAFQVKQSTSNWVAIGLCHKNVVVSKSYAFTSSPIGHGSYLISANGGSWSHTKT